RDAGAAPQGEQPGRARGPDLHGGRLRGRLRAARRQGRSVGAGRYADGRPRHRGQRRLARDRSRGARLLEGLARMHGARVSLHRTNEPLPPSGDLALRLRVDALYAEYAQVIDDDRLEEWPALFAENGKYRVTTRENHGKGLALAIMYCDGRGMMSDRIS